MARKGSRQKNGLNRDTASHQHAVPVSKGTSVSDNHKESLKAHDENNAAKEPSAGDPQNKSSTPSGNGVNNTKSIGSGKRNKQRSVVVPCKEKSENGTSTISESMETSYQARADVENDTSSDTSEPRIQDGVFYGINNNWSNTISSLSKGVPMGKLISNCSPSVMVASQKFRALTLHAMKRAERWVKQQKPLFDGLITATNGAYVYMRGRVEYISPIIWTWALYFGKLMFLLSMVLLDCNIRGFDSLLHLGTTSFLTVFWCSVISVTAIIGITKMLMIMVVAALVAVFIGFALPVLITGFLAMVIVWLYGSFWTTGFVIFLGGMALVTRHERVALFITTLYSMHCARSYAGWLGLLLGLDLAFISSDVLVHVLNNVYENRESQGRAGPFSSEPSHSSSAEDAFQSAYGTPADRCPGVPSTSGTETELTSEDEVVRLLNCNDHYSALGLSRYENIDVSSLKREYRKKAMLVHPDKNMSNEKAADAFKKLQNAYEVLLDSLKRKTYDDELRREELLDYIRRFQSTSHKNGRHGIFGSGVDHFEGGGESSRGESRRIACKKCGDFHIWIRIERSKSRARWCQDCKDFHQAKDGDGWVEQSSQPLMFGLLQKMDPPCVYVCAESRIYDATEWFVCQGMRCPPNTHKPSFHINASVTSKHSNAKGGNPSHRGSAGASAPDMDETMSEEEFFEWLQNAVQSGMFEASGVHSETPSPRSSASGSRSVPKKRKGKKQW